MIDYIKFWMAAKIVEFLIAVVMILGFAIFWVWVTRNDK